MNVLVLCFTLLTDHLKSIIDIIKPAAQGLKFDYAELGRALGVPVVPIQANNGTGLPDLTRAIRDAADRAALPKGPAFPEAFDAAAARLQKELSDEVPPVLARRLPARAIVIS